MISCEDCFIDECVTSVEEKRLACSACTDNGFSDEEIEEMMLYDGLKNIIGRYGVDKQEDVAIEELSELIKAILKLRRAHNTDNWDLCLENIFTEIADVQIMLWQLMIIHNFNKESIMTEIHRKISRTLERMKNE